MYKKQGKSRVDYLRVNGRSLKSLNGSIRPIILMVNVDVNMEPTLTQDFLNACFAMLFTKSHTKTFSPLLHRATPYQEVSPCQLPIRIAAIAPRWHYTCSSVWSCSWCNHSIPPNENYARLHPCSCNVCVGCLFSGHAQRGLSPLVCFTCDSTIESHVLFQDKEPIIALLLDQRQ